MDTIVTAVKAPGPHGAAALGPMIPWVAALAGLSMAASLGHTAGGALTAGLKPRIQVMLERQILQAAIDIPLADFEQPELHDRLQRARQALGYRMTNLLLLLAGSTQAVVTLIAYGIVLWLASPWLTLVVLLPAAPAAWFKVRAGQSWYIHDYDATPVRRMMAYVRGLVLGATFGQEMRVFQLSHHFRLRWGESHAIWWRETMAKAWAEATSNIGTTVVQVTAYAIAIAILAALIVGGRVDIGEYVVLTGAAAAFQGEIEGLLWQVRHMVSDLPQLRDLQDFLDLGTEARARAGRIAFRDRCGGGCR